MIRDPWVWPDNPAYLPQPHLQKLHTEGQRTLLFYLAHTGYHALLHTKHANNSPTTRDTHIRMPLDARSMGSARQTGHTPHSRTSATPSPQRMKILTRKYLLGRVAHECRGEYCFISPTQDTMHYFTRNMPQTLQQKAPLTGCLLGKIHGFGQTTRHTPHSRTSATPSPQRMKILTRKYLLGRVAHERRGHYCFICSTIIPHRKPI